MDIFVKQSLTCVWRDLTIPDLHLYTHYDNGQRLIAEHYACTHAQLDQGYIIEIVILSTICAGLIGLWQKTEPKYSHFVSWFGGLVGGVIATGLLNVLITGFDPIVIILGGVSLLSLIGRLAYSMKNPYTIWKEMQAAKNRAARLRLKAAQEEITRLRASDPVLDDALRSLDKITTALQE